MTPKQHHLKGPLSVARYALAAAGNSFFGYVAGGILEIQIKYIIA